MKWDQINNQDKINMLATQVMGWDNVLDNWNPLQNFDDAWLLINKLKELEGFPKLIFSEEITKSTIYSLNPEKISYSALIAVGVEFE